MKPINALGWFNNLILNDFHPRHLDPLTLSMGRMQELHDAVQQQKRKAVLLIKDQMMMAKKEKQARMLLLNYYNSLVHLMDTLHDYKDQWREIPGDGRLLVEVLEKQLDEIRTNFDKEYGLFLKNRQRLPLRSLLPIREKILDKVETMEERLISQGHEVGAIKVIVRFLRGFAGQISNREVITAHQVQYTLEMLQDLDGLSSAMSINGCPQLNELLIHWNLNIQETIDYFLSGKDQLLASLKTDQEQLEFYKVELVKLQQISEKSDYIFNPAYPSLRAYFLDYTCFEIENLERKIRGFAPLSREEVGEVELEKEPFQPSDQKVEVALSSDQIGIIFRVAHELGIFRARSRRAVFRKYGSLISSLQREHPSWDNMRSKASSPEHRDIVVVVDVFQRAIASIEKFLKGSKASSPEHQDLTYVRDLFKEAIKTVEGY
ncbi:hypothetical protein [Olivibacter domesticus]|uniref:Uncharacterized protein n=1 Tax=Olivibacter domesticus TaxID=407022 RepID=A0A1H7IAE8_OLID1|nr:hypothetical protein [Olivibacter domesticus]SEK59466.1 hypothetical protein SAMN05661044_00637 [Olivibacter domesticus]